MSNNISDSNNMNSNGSYKRRISQIDESIEVLTKEVNSLNNFVNKTELEFSLMTVRMKREKLKALSAIARAQAIMADMQVCVAEGELFTDVENLKNLKKLRMDNEGASQRHTCQVPRPSTSTVSVQTTNIEEKKYRKHLRSPVDISDEVTIFLPGIGDTTTQNIFTGSVFERTKRSESQLSLSSSIKAEFNDPFTQSEPNETVPKSPTRKPKSDKKSESKNKSKSQSSSQKGTSVSVARPKTVADLRKMADKTSSASATYVPARHTDLPEIISRPSTSTMCPIFSVQPATQPDHHNSQDPRPYRLLPIYSNQQ